METWISLIQSIQSALSGNQQKATQAEITVILNEVRQSGVAIQQLDHNRLRNRAKIIQEIERDLLIKPLFQCLLEWSFPTNRFRRFMPDTLRAVIAIHL